MARHQSGIAALAAHHRHETFQLGGDQNPAGSRQAAFGPRVSRMSTKDAQNVRRWQERSRTEEDVGLGLDVIAVQRNLEMIDSLPRP